MKALQLRAPIWAIAVAIALIAAISYTAAGSFAPSPLIAGSPVRESRTVVQRSPSGSSIDGAPAISTDAHRVESSGEPIQLIEPNASKRSTGFADSIDSRATFPRATEIGYGAFVDEALASGRGELMAEAASLIKRCQGQDHQVEAMRRMLHQKPDESITEPVKAVLAAEEDIQRRCQALAASHHAQLVPLLAGAAQRQVHGSAVQLYAALSDQGRGAGAYPWLLDALVADAARGEGLAFHSLACNGIGLSLPMQQRATYFAALESLAAKSTADGALYGVMVRYCVQRPAPGVAPDPQLLASLLAAAQSRQAR